MTTTTPESRARIAYTAYCRARYTPEEIGGSPTYDQLPEAERAGWFKSANALWDLATTGHAEIRAG